MTKKKKTHYSFVATWSQRIGAKFGSVAAITTSLIIIYVHILRNADCKSRNIFRLCSSEASPIGL